MPKAPWLPTYSGQTTEQLIALRDQYRIDSIVAAFETALREKAARLGSWGGLANAERVVLAVEALEREVNNGGYAQFFLNAAQFLSDIVGALDQIGCGDVARLTEQAIGLLGVETDATVAEISNAEAKLDDIAMQRLNDCDASYQQIGGDLADPLFNFIVLHRRQIALP